jgi:hypothetical protein
MTDLPTLRMVIPAAPWTRALENGGVGIDGYRIECVSDIDNAPERFIATHAADTAVGENGVRRLILDMEKGAPPSALPVSFGPEHMQRNILVPRDSPLTSVQDLIGKRVGSRLSAMSGTGAGVLMLLELGYGLDLKAVHWYLGDPAAVANNWLHLDLHPGPKTDEEGVDLLLRGELDAMMFTTGPRYWSMFGPAHQPEQTASLLRPLVDDPQILADTYARTGIYAITDLAVVKPWVGELDPKLPAKLVGALSEANARSSEYRPAEEQRLAEQEIQLLGKDPHQYGLGADQRRSIAAFIDFLWRAGAIQRNLDPEGLFVPSTLGQPPLS